MIGKNKISGVVCEFNPLHNGHAALLSRMSEEFGSDIVCVMSGNFVQRGEAAVLDKWSRTRLALQNGAALVLELPLPWAVAGAEKFARGGISLLNALGCVDTLTFGSETGDTAPLMHCAEYLHSDVFNSDIRPEVAKGISFAAARMEAVKKALGAETAELLTKPNCILGIEYCKAILSLNSNIAPQTVQRIAIDHDSDKAHGAFASASLIRSKSAEGEEISAYVPENTAVCIRALQKEKQYPASLSYLDRAVLAAVSAMLPEDLRRVPDVSEGIENRILAAAETAETCTGLFDAVKTKRYSHARIRRIVLSAYLGITNDLPNLPPYLRILGMTSRGAEILHKAKPMLPIIARPADVKKLSPEARRVFALEARADNLYSLCTEHRRPANMDYTEKLIRI